MIGGGGGGVRKKTREKRRGEGEGCMYKYNCFKLNSFAVLGAKINRVL